MLTDSLPSRGQAKDIMCDYKPGILENSAKMVLLFHLIEESVRKGDKLLVFRYKIMQHTSTSNIKHYYCVTNKPKHILVKQITDVTRERCYPLFRFHYLRCLITFPPAGSWLCPLSLSCSQSLSTLTVIEDFLAKRPVPPSPNRDGPNQNWVRNLNYYSKQ